MQSSRWLVCSSRRRNPSQSFCRSRAYTTATSRCSAPPASATAPLLHWCHSHENAIRERIRDNPPFQKSRSYTVIMDQNSGGFRRERGRPHLHWPDASENKWKFCTKMYYFCIHPQTPSPSLLSLPYSIFLDPPLDQNLLLYCIF